MKLKINEEITLATSQQVTGAVLCLFNSFIQVDNEIISADLKVWPSETAEESGNSPTYLFKDNKAVNSFRQPIPSNQYNNYIGYIKTALSDITGAAVENIDVLE